jgi:diketogulonate reductase-like aldo/keto reductase
LRSLTLTHRRAIDRSKEALVKAAEKLLDDANVKEMGKNDFGHSQLRNLIAIALETESPAVVTNFICYQMGRDRKGKSWSNLAGGKTLGDRFIDEIDKNAVKQALETIVDEKKDVDLVPLVRIELIRHFLGFASRYLKFLDLQRHGNEEGEAA